MKFSCSHWALINDRRSKNTRPALISSDKANRSRWTATLWREEAVEMEGARGEYRSLFLRAGYTVLSAGGVIKSQFLLRTCDRWICSDRSLLVSTRSFTSPQNVTPLLINALIGDETAKLIRMERIFSVETLLKRNCVLWQDVKRLYLWNKKWIVDTKVVDNRH